MVDYKQIEIRLSTIECTKDTYVDAMRMMVRTRVVEGMEPTTKMSADQVALLIYLSAGTNERSRSKAIYAFTEDKACAWCEEAHSDIISYLVYLIQDTWRPFGMVDYITFFRNSGAAVSNQDTNPHKYDYDFESCLYPDDTNEEESKLSGWDLMRLAAAYCGDVVGEEDEITMNCDA